MIKKYLEFINENVDSDEAKDIQKMIESFFDKNNIHCEAHVWNKNGSYSGELTFMDVEPEVGSYVDRTDVYFSISETEGGYKADYSLISGEYGADEEDEDFEPEFDWDISASKEEGDHFVKTNDINEFITSFCNFLLKDILPDHFI